MKEVVGIRFKKAGKMYYFDPAGLKLEREDGAIVAYLRVLDRGVSYDTASIGRIITTERGRGRGIGRILVNEGLRVAKEAFGADRITISAQCQARGFYEKFGFSAVSDVYLEDDIPHVRMVLDI